MESVVFFMFGLFIGFIIGGCLENKDEVNKLKNEINRLIEQNYQLHKGKGM